MKTPIRKISPKHAEVLILVVFLLVNLRVLNWFQPGYVVFSGDLRPPIVPNVFLNNALHTWNQVDWGIPSVYTPRLLDPFLFLMTAFQSVGINAYVSEIMATYFIYFFVAILMYMYIKRLTNGDILAAFIGALFFIANIHLIVDREQTAIGFMDLSLMILPCLVTFTEGIKKKSLGFMAISGFLFTLTYAAFPNYRAPVLCLIAIFITVVSLYINKSPRTNSTEKTNSIFTKFSFDWSIFRRYAKYLAVFFVAIFLASIWFIALVYANLGSLSSALSQATTPLSSAFGNRAPDVLRLIAQWSFYWSYWGQSYVPYAHVYLTDPVMIVLSYMPTILAFAAIFLSKSRKTAVFFGSVAFLFLLLTSGSSELFSQFYGSLMDVFPLLRAFRTSTNWIFIVTLTFSMLIGLFASGLCRRIRINALKILVIFLTVELLFLTTYPLMTGDVTSNWLDLKTKGAYIPPYFKDAENAMSNKHWTILLPQRNSYPIYNFTDGGILSSGNPYPLVFSKPFLSGIGTEYVQSQNLNLLTTTYELILRGPTGIVAEKASASSVQNDLQPDLAVDGNSITRWASTTGMPQWYEMDWSEKQQLSGIKIRFENAYASDYNIETWNGNSWVLQILVENNTSLTPEYQFPQETPTTKLRINFTKAPLFDMVSILEIEINPQQYPQTDEVPKFMGMLGIKNLLVESKLVAGNFSDIKDIGILNLTKDITLVYRWNGASLYENAYALEKFYPADNLLMFSDVLEMEQKINATVWSTLEHSVFVNSNSDTNWFSIETLQTPDGFSWKEISPTSYQVNANSDEPFILVFLEGYDSHWEASVNGKPITENNHLIVNDFANGWMVNDTGNLSITIEYETQNLITASVTASIVLPAIFVVVIIRKKIKEIVSNIFRKNKKRKS